MKKVLLPILLGLLTVVPAQAQAPAAGPTAAPARRVPTLVPRFEADYSQDPSLQPWALAAESLCQVWYARVVQILDSDDTQRPLNPVVKIIFEKELNIPAYAAGSELHISGAWVKAHPDDFGMVIHELTHLVQRYGRNRAGWLVEGIADYVRLHHYETQVPRPRLNFDRAKYTDAYKTTAMFLIWIEGNHGPTVVQRLGKALRAGNYSDELFKELTGKDVDALWADFAAATKAKQGQ